MAEFFAELKRRHIYRVAAGYAVLAWLLLQVVNNVAPILALPVWVARAFLLLLVIGLPVALFFAWMRELPSDISGPKPATSKFDYALMGALIVVIGLVSFQQLAPSRTTSTQKETGVEAAKAAAASPRTGISLAVLPFGNLSSDPEQEFFSDGITEEITAALAKVPDLRVVGRTSAFEFKGQNRDLRAIGQALSATHLIEGSVRKAGDRVRITAQLISATDGTHLWSENYDRELTDIFAIQEDIARAIATSLRMPLGLKPGENLVANRDIDPELYQEYLRIRAKQSTAVNNASRLEAIEGLQKLLTRAPDFPEAWAALSGLHFQVNINRVFAALGYQPIEEARRDVALVYEQSEKAAREAIRLDEVHGVAYRSLAEIAYHRNNWAAAEDLFRKGLALDPYDPDFLAEYVAFLVRTGRVKQGLQVAQEVHALEPLTPAVNLLLAWAHLANNQPEAAIALLEGRAGIGAFGESVLASAYAMTGRFDKAADSLLRIEGNFYARILRTAGIEQLIRDAPQKARDPRALPPLPELLNFVHAYVGAGDRLLDVSERALEADVFGELRYLFHPIYSPARQTERFKTLVRKAGLVDYWKARGWPDMCRPTTGDDFECN
jgi:TolB-like protein